jgi:WD40 repeat protein
MVISNGWDVKVCRKSSPRESSLNPPFANAIGAMSPDGKTVAIGDWGGTLSLWDPGSGGEKCFWETHVRQTDIVAFSYDGEFLATAGENNSARIWDSSCSGDGKVESLKQLRSTLSGHGGAVTAIAFSRDGARVATGSLDGTAKVWDVSSNKNPKELYSFSHATGVESVDLSPDGGLLATVSADGYVRVYRLNIDIDHLVSLAKERVSRGRKQSFTAGECKNYAPDGNCVPLVGFAAE